jgi:hypothetical protein
MARRSEDSLDVLGESLLSQQADRRKKAEKRRRRDQKKLLLMTSLVAGQSVVNNALKKRTKELADLGEISKLKSKTQAENMSFYAPIYQAMEGSNNIDQFKINMRENPEQFRALQAHIDPAIRNEAKKLLGPDADDPIKFGREFGALKDTMTFNLIERAFGKDKQGRDLKTLYSQGATKFANLTGVDPADKQALLEYMANATQNDVDAYKARELNRRNGNFSTSVMSKDAADAFLQAFSFGLLKKEKGENSMFKSIDPNEALLPEEMQAVIDNFNVKQLIKNDFATNYATMRDEPEAFANNKTAKEAMTRVWDETENRITQGTTFDAYGFFGFQREGGHRYSAHAANMIGNAVDFVNDRAVVKDQLINQAGALATMLGDPQRPKLKESIMNQWLELPHIKEYGITKGDAEYRQVLGYLDSLQGRQEFAIDFTLGLSIKNDRVFGFGVDFSEIKSITEPKFKIVSDKTSDYTGTAFGQKGNLRFQPTDVYNSLSTQDKNLHYKSYLQAIIQNQTRSKNNPEQLRSIALQFMQDIPPPDGRTPEEVLNSILEPEYVPPQGTMTEYETDLTSNQKKNLIDVKIPKLHPSINTNNLVPIMDYHLGAVNNDGTPRLKGDKDKNQAIMVNQFLPALFDTESDFNYSAKNDESSAYGGGQIIRTSLIPALNRLNKAGVKPKEEQMIRENMSRIDSLLEAERNKLVAQGMTDEDDIKDKLDELGRIEYFKFMDKANLSESLQQQLVLADLLEKTMVNEEGVAQTGVGDTLWNALFNSTNPLEQYRAALEIYYRGHHTAPDKDTIKRAEKMFRPYFLN